MIGDHTAALCSASMYCHEIVIIPVVHSSVRALYRLPDVMWGRVDEGRLMVQARVVSCFALIYTW